MPEESFSTANQVSETEKRGGRFLKPSLLRRIFARDVEIMDRMAKGGPPTSVTIGSAIQRQGDLVYTVNTTLGGFIYCDSFTVNPGVTITVNKFLHIIAKNDVTVHGHINADGIGIAPAGDTENRLPITPARGISAGGGGGGGDDYPGGNGSPGLSVLGGTGGIGRDDNGGNATAMPLLDKSIAFVQRYTYMLVGGGAGGNGGMSTGPYPSKKGGAGGGYIEIQCRSLTVSSNGLISARGFPGVDQWDLHWGASGGGGGGMIYVRCAAYAGADRIDVSGGTGGVSRAAGATSGGNGADGVVQIEIFI